MNVYINLIYKSIKRRLQYRVNSLFFSLKYLLILIMQVFLWKSIYGEKSRINSLELNHIILYFLFGMILFNLISNPLDRTISDDYRLGNIRYDFIKPYNYFWKNVSVDVGRVISSFILSIPMLIMAILLFSSIFREISYLKFSFFVISSFVSYGILVCMNCVIGLTSVWTGRSIGFTMMKESLTSLLGGVVIPLDFYPSIFKKINMWLPFQYIYYVPLEGFLNKERSQLFKSLFIQIIYLFIFYGFYIFLYKKARCQAEILGG